MPKPSFPADVRALGIVVWRQESTATPRGRFWRYMFGIAAKKSLPAPEPNSSSVLAHS